MKANTPLEQLMFNTNDIKMLKEKIHEFYNCSIDLGNTSVSVAVSNTNMPTDIKDGYIVDINGNVYKFIAFDTDATTAYIEYYASLKGADGKDGADDIDDTTTANNKLWSSQKINNELLTIKGLIDKGVYITTTEPTPEDATYYTLLYEDIDNIRILINPENEDLIIYIDSNGKAKELYKIYAHAGDYSSFTLVKVADMGGGKQLYKHNIRFHATCNDGSNKQVRGGVSIINDSPTEFTEATLKTYLYQKGFIITHDDTTTYNKFYNEATFQAASTYTCTGIATNSDLSNPLLYTQTTNAKDGYMSSLSIDEWLDTVIPL